MRLLLFTSSRGFARFWWILFFFFVLRGTRTSFSEEGRVKAAAPLRARAPFSLSRPALENRALVPTHKARDPRFYVLRRVYWGSGGPGRRENKTDSSRLAARPPAALFPPPKGARAASGSEATRREREFIL